MEKNKKNKKLIILVGMLLLVIGVSFAYWTGVSDTKGNGKVAEGNITIVKGAELNVQGKLEFNDIGILPGHKNVSSVKVTATGNNELIPYNLIWNGTNELNTPLNFTIYKTSVETNVEVSCQKQNKVESGLTYLSEECIISNLDKLGSKISAGTIEANTSNTKVILAEEEFITAINGGQVVYYYIILEYPNLEENQNTDMGKGFNGEITAEESNAKADINIIAVKIKQEDGTYKDSDDIPQEGYKINQVKSICSNGATVNYNYYNNTIEAKNITKSGTSCYLYFDKMNASDKILTNIEIKKGATSFKGIATTDEGVFSGTDDDGTTYYYRGAVNNNYLKFAGFWWRIIRINGDGSIRIICDGMIGTSAFNTSNYDNANVGFMYGKEGASTYEETHANINKSAILISLEEWYTDNLESYESRIDTNAGFCGDRSINTGSTSWWQYDTKKGFGTNATAYGPWNRIKKSPATPTFNCPNSNDLYTVKGTTKGNKALDKPIGLITADETVYAGGLEGINNTSYYLRNNTDYWTISPSDWTGKIYIFYINSSGALKMDSISSGGIRPVINLRADVSITGSGTQNDPFVVN